MKTAMIPALAIALALAAPAFAQSTDKGPSQGSQMGEAQSSPGQTAQSSGNKSGQENGQNAGHQSNVLTINKLKQDLQNAGFTDIQILGDSFVVQAKDKQGNPTVMSLSPSGVFAISEISQQQRSAKASTSSSGSEPQHR